MGRLDLGFGGGSFREGVAPSEVGVVFGSFDGAPSIIRC